jgi:hypothetical protein
VKRQRNSSEIGGFCIGLEHRASHRAAQPCHDFGMACKCIIPRAYETRISRPWWARLIPWCRLYYCRHCQEKSLYFFSRR